MNGISKTFLFLGIFTTPFYIFSSGSLQPSHFFLLLFVFFFLIYKKGFYVEKKLFLMTMPFFAYVLIVNLVYSLYYQDTSFFSYPLNLTFDLLIMFSLVAFLKEANINIIEKVPYFVFTILIMLFSLWFWGLGEYKYYPRYNGYFNDPNQMAFFVLCVTTIACLYIKNIYLFSLTLFFALALILFTQSRSAILGVFMLVSSLLFLYWRGNKNSVLVFMSLVLVVSLVLMISSEYLLQISYVQSVVERFSEADIGEQSDVRGYTRILNFKEYLLFGAGQGLDMRFNSPVEIHSTWAGIFFYYGIIGISLFLYFLINIFKNLNIYQKILFLVPLMYSFSTFGARTVIFWILLACFYQMSLLNKYKKGSI